MFYNVETTFIVVSVFKNGSKATKTLYNAYPEISPKFWKKYGKHMTPQKRQRVCRALYDVSANKFFIHKAAEEFFHTM